MTLRIYLTDLSHTGAAVATEGMPLNIGLIASYALRNFGGDIEFTLFKYPEDLSRAIDDAPPHVLGCSNYTWNANLSYHFAERVKSIDRDILTVWGGTNYPFDAANQEKFLRVRPAVDAHIFYEGEQAFTKIIERRLSVSSVDRFWDKPIESCQFIRPSDGAFVSGAQLPRFKDLDSIPSPYATGLLDKFFDGVLTPLVETTRGCPFTCNFCNAGDAYFNKINKFSDDYVRDEFSYIAKRCTETGVGHLTICDNNFGMIPRDASTAQLLYDLKRKHGWPSSVSAWTGKNAKERVIDATRLLGETLNISMSVQSMDPVSLRNIKRDNIKLDHYRAIAEELHDRGRPQLAEVIMPLPGETLQSHIDGLNALLDTKVSRILSHTLQMLHGTAYKDDEAYRRDLGYRTRYRVVPLDFSSLDGDAIFDVEEVGVATKDFSFEEYLEARVYMLLIELCFNSRVFAPLIRYLRENDIAISEWVSALYRDLDQLPREARAIIDGFKRESAEELWESEGALVAHYGEPENYRRLVDGEAGGNVLFKHRILMLSEVPECWVNAVFASAATLLREKSAHGKEGKAELDELRRFVHASVTECYSPQTLDRIHYESFGHDVPAWLEAPEGHRFSEVRSEEPITLAFGFYDHDKIVFRDGYKRYGADISGIIKLIQRTSNTPYRHVTYVEPAIAAEAAERRREPEKDPRFRDHPV